MHKCVKLFSLSVFMLVSAAAMSEVRFNGFASVRGGVTFDSDETLYGYDSDISFKEESLFALQAKSDLGEGLSATVQLLAKGSDDFEVEAEWAYLTYVVSDKFEISAGRMRVPFFKYSEFIDVGYAYPWARLPQDVYDIGFDALDGIRFNYNTSAGFWDLNWELVYGGTDDNLDFNGQTVNNKADNLISMVLNSTYDWFSFRIGYTFTSVTLSQDLSAFQPLFSDPNDYDDLIMVDDDAYFGNVGVFVDYNDWLLNAEVIQFEAEDNLTVKTDAFYVMLGKRFENITLTYTYSESEESNDFDIVNSIPEQIPNPDQSTIAFCGATARAFVRNCVIAGEAENSTHNIALRWNFHPAAAFTIDYTSREFDLLNNMSSDQSEELLSFGIDLVF